MKKVLRSLIWTNPLEKDEAIVNYKTARPERLINLTKTENEVFRFVLDFFVTYNEAPSYTTIFDEFTKANDPEAVILIEEIQPLQFFAGASFIHLFEEEVETQAVQKLSQTCKEAVKIATTGLTVRGVTTKGVDSAVAFLFSSAQGKPPSGEGKIPANLRKAGTALQDLYTYRKNNPDKSYGMHLGYALIDASTMGIRKKSLYLVAGFNGELKSTLFFNMIVNSSTDGGWNNILFTSEMPADDVKLMTVAIHSANPKFNGVSRPLDSRRLLLGALNQQEEDFFKLVDDDLRNNPNHGSIRIVDSGEFTTLGSIMQRTIREHSEEEIDACWIDYITRLPTDLKYTRLNITEARNETLAEAKRFAMGFDKGVGIPVCSAFQTNREGWKRAKENAGKYDLSSLAQYNAAEKEADVISTIFYGEEERTINEPKVGLLKSRYGNVPNEPVSLYLEPDSRRLFDMASGMRSTGVVPTAAQKSGEEEVQI